MDEKKSFNWTNSSVLAIGALAIIGGVLYYLLKTIFGGVSILDLLNSFIGVIAGIAFIWRYYIEKKKESEVIAKSNVKKVAIGLVAFLIIISLVVFIPSFLQGSAIANCDAKVSLSEKSDCYTQLASASYDTKYCAKLDSNTAITSCLQAVQSNFVAVAETCCPSSNGNFDEEATQSSACCKQKFFGKQNLLISCVAYCSEKSAVSSVARAYQSEGGFPTDNNLGSGANSGNTLPSDGNVNGQGSAIPLAPVFIILPKAGDLVHLDRNLLIQLKVGYGDAKVNLTFTNQADQSKYPIPFDYTVSSRNQNGMDNLYTMDDFNIGLSFSDWQKTGQPLPTAGQYVINLSTSSVQNQNYQQGSNNSAIFTITDK
ncbi:MAG: DUF308 domain-containing protein [archaeon]